MSVLNELLGQRAEFVAQLDALDAKAVAATDDDEDELITKEMEEIGAKLKKIDAKIKFHGEMSKIKAEAAKPVQVGANAGVDLMVGGAQRRQQANGGHAVTLHGNGYVQAVKQAWEEPGIAFARFVKCWVGSRQNIDTATQIAAQLYPDDHRLNFKAAQAQNVGTAGGFLVPEQYARELVDYLRHLATVRPNAVIVPITGTMVMPVQTSGSAGAYIGENTDDNAQDLTIGQVRFVARTLRAMIASSNDLIRNSTPEADMIIRNDLAGGLAEAEDLAFIRGSGIGDNPKGMRNWAPTANVNNGSGTTSAAIEADLIAMVARITAAKKNQNRALRWFMPSRSFYKLWGLRHAIGSDPVSLVFPEIRSDAPRLIGHPVSMTDQIPTTLGGGTETEIYLVDMADAMIGQEMGIEIAVSDTASYKDAAGTLVSAFSRNQTVIRAIAKHDFVMRRQESVQILTGTNVTW